LDDENFNISVTNYWDSLGDSRCIFRMHQQALLRCYSGVVFSSVQHVLMHPLQLTCTLHSCITY